MEGTQATEAFCELNPCDVTDSMDIKVDNVFMHGEYCTVKVVKFQVALRQDSTLTSTAARIYPTLKNPVRKRGDTGGLFVWEDNPQAARIAEEYTYYRPMGVGVRIAPVNSSEQDAGTIYVGSGLPTDDTSVAWPQFVPGNPVRDSPVEPSSSTLTQQKGYLSMPYRTGAECVMRMAPFTRIMKVNNGVYDDGTNIQSAPQAPTLVQYHWNKHEFRDVRENPNTIHRSFPDGDSSQGTPYNIADALYPHIDVSIEGLSAAGADRTVATMEITMILCLICRDKTSTGQPERPVYLGAALAPGDMGSGRPRDVAVKTTLVQFVERQVAKAKSSLSIGGKVAEILAPVAGLIGGSGVGAAVMGAGAAMRGLGNVGVTNSSAVLGSYFRG